MRVIRQAEDIIEEYQKQGFVLTLRQLFYQFVSRDLIPNKQKEYKRLGSIIDDAKNAGMLPWKALEDRTRFLRKNAAWSGPAEIIESCASQFHLSRWATQKYQPEVWIEKDALVGVIEGICESLDVPYFACRGYVSGSAQWRAGQRALEAAHSGRKMIVFHLGDHDPSGIDMTRDNLEKINLYGLDDDTYSSFPDEDQEVAKQEWCEDHAIEVRRLALNMAQVRQYNPPPNPAKETDSRHAGYSAKYGDESWELDALEPRVIAGLIQDNVSKLIDWDAWKAVEREEKAARKKLAKIAEGLR